PRRIASDQEGMGRVEERDAAAGVARRENDLESIKLLAIVQDHVDRGARMVLRTGRAVVDAFAGDEFGFDAVGGYFRRRTVFDGRESAHMVGMRVGYEDRREVLGLHADVVEVVHHLARIGVGGCVHQDQSIVDEERRRRVCLDDMHTLQEFHKSHPRGHRRSPRYSFREFWITGPSFRCACAPSVSQRLYAWVSYAPLDYRPQGVAWPYR